MRVQMLAPAVLLIAATTTALVHSQTKGAPETFTANLQVKGATAGAGAATIQIHVQRYTPEHDRTTVETALKSGGYPAFLTALRKAPDVGYVSVGDKKWTIRWAREQTNPRGRSIVVVTDQPIFFVGGGAIDAKPREGYEVAVIQMQMDDVGLGNGMMAAAARVKPGGEAGVVIDDYAAEPIKLVTINRKIQ